MSSDRAAVAREVLTEAIEHMAGRDAVVAAHELTKLRDERYPAPAAPVTVTVEGVTWTKQSDPDGSVWIASVGGPPSRSDAEEFLDRIASDARRIEALERERGAARRALEAAQSAGNAPSSHQTPMTAALGRLAATGASAVPPRCGNPTGATVAQECRDMATATSQGEGLGKITEAEQVAAEEPGDSRVTVEAAPAPIPLGAVVEVKGDICSPYVRDEERWIDADGDLWIDDDPQGRNPLLTALYHATHADAATVERVALRVKQYNWPTAVSAEGFARIILEELGYTIQEGA